MARIKVINKGQNQDLIGGNFTNDSSKTVFSLGDFTIESNFTGRKERDYTEQLSSFTTPITLETIGLLAIESKTVAEKVENVQLNLDNSDLKSYITYGSAKEFLRISIEDVIENYPASLFVSNSVLVGGNITIENYYYDSIENYSLFEVDSQYVVNKFELVFDYGNTSVTTGEELKNLNVSFDQYVVWRKDIPDDETHEILGYTGDTSSNTKLYFKVNGNPFEELTGSTGDTNFHIKPKPIHFNKFLNNIGDFSKYMMSERVSGRTGFVFDLKIPTLLDNGEILYKSVSRLWDTTDGYNIDVDGGFSVFYETILGVGENYDNIKTDLIARFLTPSSIRVYDSTKEGKITKLLRLYGAEFDKIKQFIDSLVNINKLSYDKKDNMPDVLVKNFAKTLGWDVFTLVSEKNLVESFFSTSFEETNTNNIPSEIDIELWRRILINTAYLWKSKGTRDAIKSLFLLIGVPEPFINITEYVYTVESKINPDEVELSLEDIPSASFPFNSQGYPVAPIETPDFYFQIAGNSDSGQEYINNFRNVGFLLGRVVDNKKSWIYDGKVERVHYTTPNYFQEASELVINTKEIDVTLDIARGIEYDVYLYNRDVDEPATSTGFTRPYIFINVPFDYGADTNVFTIPDVPLSGSNIQVSFNGITLTHTGGTGTGDTTGDYYVSGPQEITLTSETAKIHSNGEKDLITLTYLHDRVGSTGYTNVQYLVQVPTVSVDGTTLTLPEIPKGDVQLVIDGITLNKGNSLFTGDFIVDPNDATKIIVQNNALKQYLLTNPVIRLWYMVDNGLTTDAKIQSEIHRVDSLSSAKLYYNSGIDKFVYVLNINIRNIEEVKLTVNGFTLQNGMDFTLNPANQKQLYLTNHPIRYGDVIGAYYVVSDESFTTSILRSDDTFPDIQDMTFLEYLELIQRRLIRVRTRKTMSNFNGGYYPTVMEIYDNYIRRSLLDNTDPLQSNGYTFTNLYPFFNQYNAFFNKFVNQLLPSTIILRKGGILIRNTSFTKQKFMYRRGVNFNSDLQWLGTDGAEYIKTLPSFEYNWDSNFICVSEINICETFFLGNITTEEVFNITTVNNTTLPPQGENVFVVGKKSDGSALIYKSTDGGYTFGEVTTIGGLQLNRIKFNGTQYGIAVGQNGTVFRTSNGGSTWSLIGDPLGTKIHLEATEAYKAIGTFGSTFVIGGNGDEYFKSTDNGLNWTDIPSAGGLSQLAKDVLMLDNNTYIVVSESGAERILKTTDGGLAWNDVDGGIIDTFNAIDGDKSNSNIALVSGRDSNIYRTTDAGDTWSLYSTLPSPENRKTYVTDIEFTTNAVYAIGTRIGSVSGIATTFFKSTDGGETWTDRTSSINSVIPNNDTTGADLINEGYGIRMSWNGNIGWIIFSKGPVLKTTNGGDTWSRINLPTQTTSLSGDYYDITHFNPTI